MDEFDASLEQELISLYNKALSSPDILYQYRSSIDKRFSSVRYSSGLVTIEFNDPDHERDRFYIIRGRPDNIFDAITIWKLKRD